MSTNDYDYQLPRHLIAQQPLIQRVDARLMVVDRSAQSIDHWHVRDLPDLLHPSDCLVVNDSQVIPARLVGRRSMTGGHWEGLFLEADDSGFWKLLGKTRGKLQAGEFVTLLDHAGTDNLKLHMIEQIEGGQWLARPDSSEDTWEILQRVGRVPLPHYIRGGEMCEEDRQRYQTVYARYPGSVAAPTAGLHFSRPLLDRLEQDGIDIAPVTLHVGLDTFRPITTETLDAHVMHTEWGQIDEEAAQRIGRCRTRGGRILAVGTTSVRVLESAATSSPLHAWSGSTDLFIRPPYQFRNVDAMMTNFHLPRTTLLVLVRCFGGDALIQHAYEEAIRQEYRFYSYGDTMLIL
ncbi:MAG: tRNA preQ1(34) S-adenosylmethionine ribosyltransferase-isomerase QueA [Planctomycetales bacterium]